MTHLPESSDKHGHPDLDPDADSAARGPKRSVYRTVERWAQHKYAVTIMAVVSFLESFIVPIPPDILLIPLVLIRRAQAWLIGVICTLASVGGGLVGYAIGVFLYEQVGLPLLTLYGYGDRLDQFRDLYNDWGWQIVLIGGFTPLPYKVITIASGASGLGLVVFTLASLISRGGRFMLEVLLLRLFGEAAKPFIERHLIWVSVILAGMAIGLLLLVRYLHPH